MKESSSLLINYLKHQVKKRFEGEGTGHDWYHIQRVFRTATFIAKKEKADLFIVQSGALLHDIADHKFHQNHVEETEKSVRELLSSFHVEEEIIQRLLVLIGEISFKGANVPDVPSTPEAKIVMDADRLDAMGAIGIARAFAYGGWKQNMIHDPEVKPVLHHDFHSYKKGAGTTINHFYEKLLLLQNRLFTDTARQLGAKRHEFMEQYLQQFYVEWDEFKGIEADNP